MVGRGDHRASPMNRAGVDVRVGLVAAASTVALLVLVLSAAMPASAAPEIAATPGTGTAPEVVDPYGADLCVEYDENGICVRWSNGQVIVAGQPELPIEHETTANDVFTVYAVTSPCGGGGPPGMNADYQCAEHRSCTDEPDRRRYQIWRQLKVDSGDLWVPTTPWDYIGTFCLNDDEGGRHNTVPEFTPESKWTTYVSLLPSGVPMSQPPGLTTLVNLKTNFYTSNEPIEHELLLTNSGTTLRVQAVPIGYHWRFGDGDDTAVTDTDRSGTPSLNRDDFEISHTYRHAGTFTVTLEMDYQMRYNSGDGWWDGPIYRSGPADPVEISVLELFTRLVGG